MDQTLISSFKCSGCTADMQFDPVSGSLKCPYCGSVRPVSRDVNEQVQEIPYAGYESAASGRLSDKAVEVTCSSCGSSVLFEPGEISRQCAFCAASFVSQPKTADPLIAPNGVLPFKEVRQAAAAKVKEWMSGLWFAPNNLKKLATLSGIHGVYLPFWTFDAQASSSYSGARGDYYYVTETITRRDSQGRDVRQQIQVRKTRWTPVAGRVNNSFDDVLVPASRSIEARYLSKLEPWDLKNAVPYETAYLSSFKAQRYQIQLPDGLADAKGIMSQGIHHTVRGDIGGDEQRVEVIQTDWNGLTFKHLLLPVWIGAYRFNGTVYQVVVNARTGEVQGERPWSVAKLVLLAAFILAVILLITWINNS